MQKKAIAHHQLSDAQPVLKQRQPPPSSTPVLLLSTMSYGLEYPSGQLGSAVRLCPLLTSRAPQPTCWWGSVRSREALDTV